MINPDIIYESIRKEIIDQKKCQFQMFSISLTITAAILAYAETANVTPLIYIAPVILNIFALAIILDKAISIQRMVGYLQIIEREGDGKKLMWEYHLNLFREQRGKSKGSESYRKHKYVRNVSLMLLFLSAILSLLYFFGPEAIELRRSAEYQSLREFYGAIHFSVILLNAFGWFITIRRLIQLIYGQYTSIAIRDRWHKVIDS